MVDKSNDGSDKPKKSNKEHVWTEAELKNLAFLVDEKKQYSMRHETLALKKSSNNQVFVQVVLSQKSVQKPRLV